MPPVTEGFITGFSAKTTDQGTVTFCGRLQRPDYTADNVLDPNPGGCGTPGQPTTSLLSRTINGRHIYYWLDDEARKLFYPEVFDLTDGGLPDTDQRLSIDSRGELFAPGDARLDCFLAGYRYDSATATETLPDCTAVGLTLDMGTPGWTTTYGSIFNGGYDENNGTQAWLDPFWEEWYDDNFYNRGIIHYSKPSRAQRFFVQAGQCCAFMKQHLDMSGATSATVTVDVTRFDGVDGSITIDATIDGVNWTKLGELRPGSALGPHSFDMSTFAGRSYVGIRVSVGENPLAADMTFDFTSIFVEMSGGGIPPPPVAPIFRENMPSDPRWGVIPQIDEFSNPNAAAIEGFLAIYAYTAYTNNSKLMAFDSWVFDPALMLSDPSSQVFSFGFAPNPVVRLIE